MPRSLKMRSASGVVGPFAPSTMSLALILGALSTVSTLLERRRHEHVARQFQQGPREKELPAAITPLALPCSLT